jgi:endogenous inhibitor of DNA gyrase (YacG/DUF329 family)
MTIESIPTFTAPAAKLWTAILAEDKNKILTNVWCSKCQHEVTITNFSGAVKAGDLLLVGKCAICQSDVTRVVEGR